MSSSRPFPWLQAEGTGPTSEVLTPRHEYHRCSPHSDLELQLLGRLLVPTPPSSGARDIAAQSSCHLSQPRGELHCARSRIGHGTACSSDNVGGQFGETLREALQLRVILLVRVGSVPNFTGTDEEVVGNGMDLWVRHCHRACCVRIIWASATPAAAGLAEFGVTLGQSLALLFLGFQQGPGQAPTAATPSNQGRLGHLRWTGRPSDTGTAAG